MEKVLSAAEAKKQKRLLTRLAGYQFYYLLMLPGILFFIIWHYLPMFGIVVAFKDFAPFEGVRGIFTSEWVGFAHFKRFFASIYFWNVLRNTLLISIYKLVIGFPMPIIFALLLNEVKNVCFKKTVQTISYLPHFISMVVIAGLLNNLLSTDGGLVNELRRFFGREAIFFLGDPKYFRSVLVLTDVWAGLGWGSIVYLAAITGVDQSLYEAARIDGANKLQQTRYITIPAIMSVVIIMFILRAGGILNAGFEKVLLLYSPSVYSVADIIDTYVYREGLQKLNYSYATAVGVFKSVVGMIMILGTDFLAKCLKQDGLW